MGNQRDQAGGFVRQVKDSATTNAAHKAHPTITRMMCRFRRILISPAVLCGGAEHPKIPVGADGAAV